MSVGNGQAVTEYGQVVNAFDWEVVGSVAGVLAAIAAVVFGVAQVLQNHRNPSVMPNAVLPSSAGEVQVVIGEIPQEPTGFQPRSDLLAELDEAAAGPRVSVVHAVTGMRGVGKTHLAATYARARLRDGWRLVAWLNAEDITAMLGGLATVAGKLELNVGVGDIGEAGVAVRQWLEKDGSRCLLVFDNATDPHELHPFIPAAGGARILITTTEQTMTDLGVGIPVDVFSDEEALAFLTDRTGYTDTEGARILARELGRLPLALAQAAAVITAQHLSYPAYLQRLRNRPTDKLLRPTGQYPRGLAAAVLLSLDTVQAADNTGLCGAVMDLMSVLSDAGVPRILLRVAGQSGALAKLPQVGEVAPDIVDEALGRLAGSSLLGFSVDDSSVTVHRLVMRVVREQLMGRDRLTAVCQAAARALETWADSLSEAWHDRAARREIVRQIMALTQYSASSADGAGNELTRAILGLRSWAVRFLNDLADSATQASQVAEALAADQERILGPDHTDTVRSRSNLAIAYQAAGRTGAAIQLHERTLADLERLLRPNHPDIMKSRTSLALAYQAAGRIDDAIQLHERTLSDRERLLGPGHPDTLASRNNLAGAYRAEDREHDAIELLEPTIAQLERLFGSDHPDILASRDNLAEAYRAEHRVADAISLHERTLVDSERLLGHEHPQTMTTRNNLAEAYQDAGRTADARKMHERTWTDRSRILGPFHPDTMISRSNLLFARHAPARARRKRDKI